MKKDKSFIQKRTVDYHQCFGNSLHNSQLNSILKMQENKGELSVLSSFLI